MIAELRHLLAVVAGRIDVGTRACTVCGAFVTHISRRRYRQWCEAHATNPDTGLPCTCGGTLRWVYRTGGVIR